MLTRLDTAKPLLADREALVGEFRDLPALASEPGLPSGYFGLFIAADSKAWPEQETLRAARELIGRGAVYVCTWGPGAGQLETQFDLASVDRDISRGAESPVIMTTSNEGESLNDAIWYASNVAWPDPAYEGGCRSLIAVAIDNHDWGEHIRVQLAAGAPGEDAA